MENKRIISYLLLIIAPLLWSGNFIIGRSMFTHIPPFTFSFFRWLFVIIILTPFIIKQCLTSLNTILNNKGKLFILSILSVTIYTSFTYLGLHYTSAINASLLNASVPILITFLSIILLNFQLTTTKAIGITSSLIGVIIIITHGNLRVISTFNFGFGEIIIFAACLSWATFTVFIKKLSIDLHPLLLLYITAIIGDVCLFPAFIFEHANGYHLEMSLITMLCILYTSLFSSIIAFTCWNIGISKIGPANAGYFFYLLPVFSTLLAIIFLNESLSSYHLIGITAISAGIYLVNKTRHKYPIKLKHEAF